MAITNTAEQYTLYDVKCTSYPSYTVPCFGGSGGNVDSYRVIDIYGVLVEMLEVLEMLVHTHYTRWLVLVSTVQCTLCSVVLLSIQ